jgi:hypothetical protein
MSLDDTKDVTLGDLGFERFGFVSRIHFIRIFRNNRGSWFQFNAGHATSGFFGLILRI